MSFLDVLKFIVPPRLRPHALSVQLIRKLQHQGRVASGIFAGMRYVDESFGSAHAPKLLGTYELELRATLEMFRKFPFPRIVDVGAAEGYYAVGCALKWPDALVIAFESSTHGQALLKRTVDLNDVQDRVEIRGHCTADELRKVIVPGQSGLLIMDVEGAEMELLEPGMVPHLASYCLIVEVHDFVDATIGETLRARFRSTHDIQEIWTRPRVMADFEIPGSLPLRWYMRRGLLAGAGEYRPGPMRWFCMTPLT